MYKALFPNIAACPPEDAAHRYSSLADATRKQPPGRLSPLNDPEAKARSIQVLFSFKHVLLVDSECNTMQNIVYCHKTTDTQHSLVLICCLSSSRPKLLKVFQFPPEIQWLSWPRRQKRGLRVEITRIKEELARFSSIQWRGTTGKKDMQHAFLPSGKWHYSWISSWFS